MDREQRRQFVRDHRTCVFGYARKEFGPAMTIVYYVMDGDDLLVSTMARRAKSAAVGRNPQVSLCVLDENWPVTYVQVYGTAVLDTDPRHGADMLVKVVELMAGEAVASWAMLRADRCDSTLMRLEGHQNRALLMQPGWSGGLPRLPGCSARVLVSRETWPAASGLVKCFT